MISINHLSIFIQIGMMKMMTKEKIAGSMLFITKSLVEETWVCIFELLVNKKYKISRTIVTF